MNRLAAPALALVLAIGACDRNRAPDAPQTPVGPPTGRTGQPLRFSSQADDPEANGVSIRFDWDDGDTSEWGPLQAENTAWADTHSWQNAGTYRVQAQAQDSKGAFSVWSAFATVDIESAETYPSRVVATVPVGTGPQDVAVLPNGEYAYVSCYDSGTVAVVRVSDGQVVADVEVGWRPVGVSPSISGDRVFVACADSHVRVIATATNTVEAEIGLGSDAWPAEPFGTAVSPDGEKLYVTDLRWARLFVVNATTYEVEDTVATGPYPRGVLACGGYLYVGDLGSTGEVTVIRASDNEVVATLAVGMVPGWMGASPDGQFVYVAVSSDSLVKAIRTSDNTLAGSLATGGSPAGTCVVRDHLYAANRGSGTVVIVRRTDGKLTATVAVGAGPSSARASLDGRYVFVTNEQDGTLSIIGY